MSSLREADGLHKRLRHSVLRTRQDARWHECLIGSCTKRSHTSDSTHDAPETAALRYFSHLYVRLGSNLSHRSDVSLSHRKRKSIRDLAMRRRCRTAT